MERDPSQASETRQFGRAAAVGLLWAMFSTAFSKGAGFVSQLVLGWVLSENDFGLYALAISLSSIVIALQDGGAASILIQRNEQYPHLARAVLKVAWGFKCAGAALIFAIAPLASSFYDAPGLQMLMWVLAANLLLGAPLSVYRAKLHIDLRFSAVAKISAFSAILRNAAMVGFALGGFGPLSFVLPSLIVTAFNWICYRHLVGRLPATGVPLSSVWRDLLGSSFWIVLAAFAGTLIQQGDYLVVGKLLDQQALGYYFFGFQLTASAAMLFTTGLRSVLMPVLSRLTHDPQRQARAYLRTIRILTFGIAPVAVLMALLAEPAIHLLWAGRWDASIPAAQLLALAYLVSLLSAMAGALMEARGRWRLRAFMLIASAVTTMIAAVIGGLFGTIFAVALCISLNRALMGIIHGWIAGLIAGVTVGQVVNQLYLPIGASIAVGLGVHVLTSSALADIPIAVLVLNAALFSIGYFALSILFMRPQWQELISLVAKRRSPAVAAASE